MNFDAAIVTEKGLAFVVILVKPEVFKHDYSINEAREIFSKYFPALPIVLMAQDHATLPSCHGRADLVRFLKTVDYMALPWKQYTVK